MGRWSRGRRRRRLIWQQQRGEERTRLIVRLRQRRIVRVSARVRVCVCPPGLQQQRVRRRHRVEIRGGRAHVCVIGDRGGQRAELRFDGANEHGQREQGVDVRG